MHNRDFLAFTLQIGAIYWLLLWLYFPITDAMKLDKLLESSSDAVKYLVVYLFPIIPILLSVILSCIFPVRPDFKRYFSLMNYKKGIYMAVLLACVVIVSLIFFAKARMELGPMGNDIEEIAEIYDKCLSKIDKADCPTITLDRCYIRETNAKRRYPYGNTFSMKKPLRNRLTEVSKKYCPDEFRLDF